MECQCSFGDTVENMIKYSGSCIAFWTGLNGPTRMDGAVCAPPFLSCGEAVLSPQNEVSECAKCIICREVSEWIFAKQYRTICLIPWNEETLNRNIPLSHTILNTEDCITGFHYECMVNKKFKITVAKKKRKKKKHIYHCYHVTAITTKNLYQAFILHCIANLLQSGAIC